MMYNVRVFYDLHSDWCCIEASQLYSNSALVRQMAGGLSCTFCDAPTLIYGDQTLNMRSE